MRGRLASFGKIVRPAALVALMVAAACQGDSLVGPKTSRVQILLTDAPRRAAALRLPDAA